MQKLPEKCCGTCRWGKFGRRRHLDHGDCQHPIALTDESKLPHCVELRVFIIWDDSKRCPTWAAKEEKMGKEGQR